MPSSIREQLGEMMRNAGRLGRRRLSIDLRSIKLHQAGTGGPKLNG